MQNKQTRLAVAFEATISTTNAAACEESALLLFEGR